MTYVAAHDPSDGVAKVIYESKDGKASRNFAALDWLVHLRRITHISNWGKSARGGSDIMEYSNKSGGLRKKDYENPVRYVI